MSAQWLEGQLPVLVNVYYWRQKEQFLLAEDVYHKWILFAVEKGAFAYQIGQESGVAERGELVFCPPNTVFKRSILRPLTFFAFNFSLMLQEEDTSSAVEAHPVHWPIGKIKPLDQQRLNSTFDHLRRFWDQHEEPYISRKQYLLQDMWKVLGWEQESLIAGKQKRNDPLMRKAEQIILERAYKPFLLRELARELGLSPVQFTRRFREQYAVTPAEYVSGLRLNQARILLVETDFTLDDIARRCGYDNGFYFSRAFSAKIGMPPSVYRQNNRI